MVVIDDEPAVHHRLARLMPGVQLVSAYQSATGLRQLRTLIAQGATIALVVVDFRLPDMDGGLLAARIRAEWPDVRIAPFSSVDDADHVIGVSGTLPLIPKRLSDDELVVRFQAALDGAPAKPLERALASYLAEQARAREELLARDERPRVALLASSRALIQLLAGRLQETTATLSCQAVSVATLRTLLVHVQADLVLCDASALPNALSVATEYQLPLIVVAMSLSAAWAAPDTLGAIVVEPEPEQLGRAVAAISAGERYRDPLLALVSQQLQLSAAEERLLPYILRETPLEDTAEQLTLSYDSVRKARSTLLQRLDVRSVAELRALIDALQSS